MKKSSFDYRAVGVSFRRAATQILESLSNAPLSLNRDVEQAVQITVSRESVFWGCPELNFKANPSLDGMRPFFATLLKETPAALFALSSNS
ncbi:MAG: hypothetical protein JSV50_08670 [Desulfobacteraceae bacterium]|nr:MAG: hypothetical protein JSV50_08670 [Desulfobacteraceae bacterium]